jgi:hypothetical protein
LAVPISGRKKRDSKDSENLADDGELASGFAETS